MENVINHVSLKIFAKKGKEKVNSKICNLLSQDK